MGQFKTLKNQLTLTVDNQLMIGPVAMILMPTWFFTGIMERTIKEAGLKDKKIKR